MKKVHLAIVLATSTIVTACQPAPTQSVPVMPNNESTKEFPLQQQNLCEVDGWQHDIAKQACIPGQKIVFLPSRWGNEQLPILFAAVNCDMRYSIALTNGGVACIYAPIEVKPIKPVLSTPERSTPQGKEEPSS